MTLTRDLVTSRDALLILLGSGFVATAAITTSMGQGQRISKVSRQTLIAVPPGRIVDALQALTCRPIAIAHGIGIHIAIAIATLAGLDFAQESCGISIEAIATLLATGTEVALGTLCTYNRILVDLQTGTIIGTGTPLTVVRSSAKSISIESFGTLIAVIPMGIVLADASARLRVTDVRMTMAIAGDAGHEWTSTGGTVPIAGGARLTELTQVSLRAGTLLNPGGRMTSCTTMSRLQLHIVQNGLTLHRVGGPDLDGRQVGQNREETASRLAGLPLVIMMLVQPEGVLLHSLIGYSIALGENGQRDAAAGSLQDHITDSGIDHLTN